MRVARGVHGAPRRSGAGPWAPASDGEGFGALAPSERERRRRGQGLRREVS